MSPQTIPVADLTAFTCGDREQQQTFVRSSGAALEQIGFFALTGHGVDVEVIRSAYHVAAQLFALPEESKRRYEVPQLQGQRGFISFGQEHAKGSTIADLKEFWHVGPEGSELELSNLWPQEVPEFRSVMLELYRQLQICAQHLLRALARYLGEPETYLAESIEGGSTILRVIHYPPIPPDAPTQSMRAAPHEDINLITLLCEATSMGLEIQQRDGSWLPIQAIPGQIIVDSGDMLQQLTNGLFKSTTHRVTNPADDRQRRFSMPFFVHPRASVDLTPLPSCIARTGGEVRFPTITAGAYLAQRLQEIGLG